MIKNKYFNKVAMLLKEVRPKLASTHQLSFKNVFGAVAGYVNGRIFISCGKFGIALRLPPKTLKSLFGEKGVNHLKYFPNGHIKKEYAVLPKRTLGDKHRLKKLLDKGIKYALSS